MYIGHMIKRVLGNILHDLDPMSRSYKLIIFFVNAYSPKPLGHMGHGSNDVEGTGQHFLGNTLCDLDP